MQFSPQPSRPVSQSLPPSQFSPPKLQHFPSNHLINRFEEKSSQKPLLSFKNAENISKSAEKTYPSLSPNISNKSNTKIKPSQQMPEQQKPYNIASTSSSLPYLPKSPKSPHILPSSYFSFSNEDKNFAIAIPNTYIFSYRYSQFLSYL